MFQSSLSILRKKPRSSNDRHVTLIEGILGRLLADTVAASLK